MTGPGYPTYTENPYEGGVDQVVPTDAIASSGLAALAAKTQQDWQEELFGAFDTTLTPLTDLLGKLFDLFSEFVDIDGFVEIASDVLGFFYGLLDRAGFLTLLEGAVALFGWLTELGVNAIEALVKPIIELLQWAWNLITGLIDVEGFQSFIQRIVDALSPLLSATAFADVFTRIVEFFTGLVNVTSGIPVSLEDLISRIPLLSTLVSAITGKTEADGVSLDLGTLQTYFRNLDDQLSDGVRKLTAAAEKLLGGIIPAAQISDTTVNLLSQGDFLTSSTVEPAGGWSWEPGRSRTGSGGSLKVDCTGLAQRIYCKQDIKVAAGDRLTLTGYVGTTGFTSGSMQLSIVPWGLSGGVMTAGTVQNGTARTTSASTYQALPQLSYTVPAGVTSIQVSLVVNCNNGCDVFFDDIRLTKTGVLPQGLVTNLLDAFNGILAGAGFGFYQGWQFLQTAIGGVAGDAADAINNTEDTNTVLFNNPDGGTLTDLANNLGTPLLSGSGARMIRTDTSNKITAGAGNQKFTGFYTVNSASSDITASASNGSFTVTHAGYYLVEVGFNANSSPPGVGAFSVAPAVYVGGSSSPYKVGGDAMGSYVTIGDGVFGNWARSAQASFIVYLPATGVVQAGYVNRQGQVTSFFQGDPDGANCYFSIAMLNRTDEG